jgi:pimeloyl-ACP methyl ester carboxylesterase
MYIEDTLKQRNLVDVDYALASLNMSDQHNLYSEGENTIKDIEVETLIIWGVDDKTVPEQMVKDNIDAIENTTFVKFNKCGHSPLVDKPDELTNVILDFIK